MKYIGEHAGHIHAAPKLDTSPHPLVISQVHPLFRHTDYISTSEKDTTWTKAAYPVLADLAMAYHYPTCDLVAESMEGKVGQVMLRTL